MNSITVCDGCCCGQEFKGNPTILHDYYRGKIEENNLSGDLKFNVVYCLGYCQPANVIKLTFGNEVIMLGWINEKQDIDNVLTFVEEKIKNNADISEFPISKKRFFPGGGLINLG